MADISRLQTYAQKRNIPFPTYSCEVQGPPHSRLFKASVTIDGNTYIGPKFCSTLKEAEHAAAKVAFLLLSHDGSEEDDRLYKSLVQEFTQKQDLPLPLYTINESGQPHIPSFSSTVQIAGECYVGKEARTKKQVEMNSAKVAYNALIKEVMKIFSTSSNYQMKDTDCASEFKLAAVSESEEISQSIKNFLRPETKLIDRQSYDHLLMLVYAASLCV